MKVYIFLLDKSTLGGIEKVACNLRDTLESFSHVDVSIIDLNYLRAKFKLVKSEPYLCYRFSQSLSAGDIVISMYDRLSIQLSFIRLVSNRDFNLIASQHADYFANRLYTRFLRRIMYRYVYAITALTVFDTTLYRKWHNNVCYIPNPILFYPVTVPSYSDRTGVVAAGRLNKIKRFNDFIDLAKIMKDFNQLSFSIFGDGEERASLYSYAEGVGLVPDDILKGATAELDGKLLFSKFLVVTSERESFSMVILEAMASGCIPISYNCPTGPRELIVNGVNGYLVEAGDLFSIRDIITKLLGDSVLAESIQANARSTAIKYKSDVIRSKWGGLLNEL